MKKKSFWLLLMIVVITQLRAQNPYWEQSTGPDGGNFTLVKTVTNALYAVHEFRADETYRSNDNGHTWQKLPLMQNTFPDASQKSLYIGEAGTFFMVVNYEDLYQSTNEGQTWTQMNNEFLYFKELPGGALVSVDYDKIVRSTDGGQNWVVVQNLPAGTFNTKINNSPFSGLAVESINDINNVRENHLFRSNDEGLTWTSTLVSLENYSLFITPAGTLLCSKSDTLYRSTNGGATFPQHIPLGGYNPPSYMVLQSGRILMRGNGGVRYSDNDGITWNMLFTESPGLFLSYEQISPLSDGTIFWNQGPSLVRSTDSGQTFQYSGVGMHSNLTLGLVFMTDSVYFANTYQGVWRTMDAGTHWELLYPNNAVTDINAVMGGASNHGVAVHDIDKLYWSPDGETFNDITPPAGVTQNFSYAYSFYQNPLNDLFFITDNNGLERSTDHGQHWQTMNSSLNTMMAMAVHPSGRLIASFNYEGQLYVSDNNGVTWTTKTLPGSPRIIKTECSPSGIFYALGQISSTTTLFKSEDAGETWINLPTVLNQGGWLFPVLNIFSIADNGYLFALAPDSKSVLLSLNEGLTWQNLPLPAAEGPSLSKRYITGMTLSPNQHLYSCTQFFDIKKSARRAASGAYIDGFARVDGDADCSTPDSQNPFTNRTVVAEGDEFSYYTTTTLDGSYSMLVDTGSYAVTLPNLFPIWWDLCDSLQSVYLPEYEQRDTVDIVAVALSECPLISVNVAAPMLRRCFDNTIYVNYCNQGTQPADSAWVDVSLDTYLTFISSSQAHQDLGNQTIRFFVGDLQIGECGDFQLVVNVDCDSTVIGQTHCISVHGYPDTLCTTLPDWSGANLEAQVACQDSVLNFTLENNGPVATQILDYIIIEDDVVMFQGSKSYNPDESLTIPLTANGHTYRLESEQEPGHPFSYRVIAFEEGCGGFESLGYINQFSVNGETPSVHRICVENTGSFDPNDKRGFPTGTGDEHRIRPGQAIEYMIRFQNTGTDTAFTVVIRDTLTQWLNPATVTPGAASHPYNWTLEGQGVVKFTFNNILLADSTTNLAGSQGFVTFSVAQQPEVPLGTQIRNDAAIFFDFNAPVITNETLHTVGVDLLSSTVDIPNQAKPAAVAVSPNPALDHTTFQLRKGNFDGQRLQLFDPLGRPVFDTEVSGAQFVMPRGQLPAGAYGWRVTDRRGGLVESGVLVFQ